MKRAKQYSWLDYVAHGFFFSLYGCVKYIPAPLGNVLRFVFAYPFLKKASFSVRIGEGVTLWYPYRISVGKQVTLNEFVYISGYGSVSIGNGVRIGTGTTIISSDHEFSSRKKPIFKQGLIKAKVVIDDGAWIGANVTILKGVTIGEGAIVAAGAVVTKDVDPYTVVGGVPARKIGDRS
jgi:acetyltransferase-like isoleucine patch superfamily enzyme